MKWCLICLPGIMWLTTATAQSSQEMEKELSSVSSFLLVLMVLCRKKCHSK